MLLSQQYCSIFAIKHTASNQLNIKRISYTVTELARNQIPRYCYENSATALNDVIPSTNFPTSTTAIFSEHS